jgi:hypothetical protein
MEYISEIIDKLGTDNIEYYGLLEPSDKYAQGIDVNVSPRQEPWEGPAVYFLTDEVGLLLKVGQTANLHNRMFRQYKCVVNATNNRIREHIREVSYMRVYYIPLQEHAIDKFGYELKTSYSSALEYHLLKEYKKTYDRLPELNTMIK